MSEEVNADVQDFDDDEIIIRKKKVPEMKTGVTAASILKVVATGFETLRTKHPRVQCMMSAAATNLAANVLLALGAEPVMVEDLGEASQLADMTDGLFVNTGFVSKPQTDAMRAAVSHANMGGHPWVFDPVRVGLLPLRTFLAKELIRRFPAIIRGNASEIAYLAGNENVWKSQPPEGATIAPMAMRLASVTHAAVIVSGATEYVASEGAPLVAIGNDQVPYLGQVAGMGCVQGVIGSAFLGILGGKARWESSLAASLVTSVAAEKAVAKADGPGTFPAALIDALASLTADDILSHGKVQVAG